MVKMFFIFITMLAIISVTYKRIKHTKFYSVKKLIHDINRQYIFLFKGKSQYLSFWQWMIFILSQGFLVIGIMIGIFEDLYKYISDNHIVAVKISTIIFLVIVTYFIVGYLLLSFGNVYKCLYKIQDKNTKSDLVISYFIISMYMTILLIFPEKFGENYKIGLVGVALSYLLNLKVLLKIIRSPEIVEVDKKHNINYNHVGVVAGILLVMVLLSLGLGVCFVSSSSAGAYTNNPTYFDLFYYTLITFTTVGYGDISPVSTMAKLMGMVISITSVLCLTIFVSSVLSYKKEE